MTTPVQPPSLDPELLSLLRCPVAITEVPGDDPGRLTLIRDGWWLFAADSGCAYPIVDGVPQTLPEIGLRWRNTPHDDLPVPPTHADATG